MHDHVTRLCVNLLWPINTLTSSLDTRQSLTDNADYLLIDRHVLILDSFDRRTRMETSVLWTTDIFTNLWFLYWFVMFWLAHFLIGSCSGFIVRGDRGRVALLSSLPLSGLGVETEFFFFFFCARRDIFFSVRKRLSRCCVVIGDEQQCPLVLSLSSLSKRNIAGHFRVIDVVASFGEGSWGPLQTQHRHERAVCGCCGVLVVLAPARHWCGLPNSLLVETTRLIDRRLWYDTLSL